MRSVNQMYRCVSNNNSMRYWDLTYNVHFWNCSDFVAKFILNLIDCKKISARNRRNLFSRIAPMLPLDLIMFASFFIKLARWLLLSILQPKLLPLFKLRTFIYKTCSFVKVSFTVTGEGIHSSLLNSKYNFGKDYYEFFFGIRQQVRWQFYHPEGSLLWLWVVRISL